VCILQIPHPTLLRKATFSRKREKDKNTSKLPFTNLTSIFLLN
jgi:hypothetical protein